MTQFNTDGMAVDIYSREQAIGRAYRDADGEPAKPKPVMDLDYWMCRAMRERGNRFVAALGNLFEVAPAAEREVIWSNWPATLNEYRVIAVALKRESDEKHE